MKNSQQYSIFVQGVKTHRKTDKKFSKTIRRVDHQLLLEFYRLIEEYERVIAASGSGVRLRKQGADYNLAHPLARKDMPTDALSPRKKSARNRAHIIGDTALLWGMFMPTKPKADGR